MKFEGAGGSKFRERRNQHIQDRRKDKPQQYQFGPVTHHK